jgi:hypothetical protein
VLNAFEALRVTPIGLSAHQATLDDVFLQLTGHRLQQDETREPSAQPGAANG